MIHEEVVLAKLRIGHMHLTHTCIVKNEWPPLCDLYDERPTVKHILIECNHLTPTRIDFSELAAFEIELQRLILVSF